MAIFHLAIKQIKRQTAKGKIKKVTSIVAYRERIKIDKFDYSRRNDFITSFCLFPSNFEKTDYAEKLKKPEFFANEIEKIEKRKDSQLFDEIIIALPHELTVEENKEIITKLITAHYISTNNQMARVCIHKTKTNLHCHILIPQRPLILENGKATFGKKIRLEFSKFGKPKSSERLKNIREHWAEIVNTKLTEIGSTSKISHKSLKNLYADALSVGDFDLAAKFNRPAFYLPTTAYSSKFKLIVHEKDRFLPNFEKMAEARRFYAKRKDLERYTWDNLMAEKKFWDDLEEKNQIKIGVGMGAIRLMTKRLLRIISNNNTTELEKNDRKRRIKISQNNPASIFSYDQPNLESVALNIRRTSRTITNYSDLTPKFNRDNDKTAISGSNQTSNKDGRDGQIDQNSIRDNQLAFPKSTTYNYIWRNNRNFTGQRIPFTDEIKRTRKRKI